MPKQTFEEAQEAFVQFCEQRMQTALFDLLNRLSDEQATLERVITHRISLARGDDIQTVRPLVGGLQTQEIGIRGRIRRIESQLAARDTMQKGHREMYIRMCSIPRVKEIRIHGSMFYVTTDMLYGKYPEHGTWHKFYPGRAEISIPKITTNPQRSEATVSVTWRQLDFSSVRRQVVHFFMPIFFPGQTEIAMIAPQIQTNIKICLGEQALKVLGQDLREHNYHGIVSTIVRFAECFGEQSSAGWPQVPWQQVPQWYIRAFGK